VLADRRVPRGGAKAKAILMRPFTDERHERCRGDVARFAAGVSPDAAPAAAVRALAGAGLLRLCVPAAFGGAEPAVSPLMLVVAREELARASGTHDALFAVQALAALAIARAGGAAAARWLPALADGRAIGAFALTERESGSDPAALATAARPDGDGYRLDGEKVLISSAGLATLYVVFARIDARGGGGSISAFAVEAGTAGLTTTETPVLGDHLVGTLRLDGVRVSADARLGEEGDGLAAALATLETMRPTVGAAACGMAARAIDETRAFVGRRVIGGAPLVERDSVQMRLAEMLTDLQAARLLVYRAAWLREQGPAGARLPVESSMAKLFATEAAQRIVDAAVQLHGGLGVLRGVPVERLYREVRALRIYEGTSEIQKLIIARAPR
jgi:acyl-CoA dehydrogenase